MQLAEIRARIAAAAPASTDAPFAIALSQERNGRTVHLALTARLERECRRARVWLSRAFLSACKNVAHGFDPRTAMSPGGRDGIFLLTRDHRPANEMMRKLFDRFLDRDDGQAEAIAKSLNTEVSSLLPVRLVSHHLRLLGVLHRRAADDILVLVDQDASD